jgi:hypothetical protein
MSASAHFSSVARLLHSRPLLLNPHSRSSNAPDDLVLDAADLHTLGLDDESNPLSELDWAGLYYTFSRLRSIMPRPTFSSVFDGATVQAASVEWFGAPLSRRRCHMLLLKLDHHISLLHMNYLSYSTQVQAEIILGVDALMGQHEAEMATMLRDTGHAHLTTEFIANLRVDDPERIILEQALTNWKATQIRVRRERIGSGGE